MGDLWAATASLPGADSAAWIPVWIALIGAVQLIWVEMLRRKVDQAKTEIVETKAAVVKGAEATTELEKQINSNLEKQFAAFKNEILATERQNVAEKTDVQDQLIAATAKASKAEGKEEERVEKSEQMKEKQLEEDILKGGKK